MIASRCATLATLFIVISMSACQPDPRDRPAPESLQFEVLEDRCGHDLCSLGPPVNPDCHPCARAVCQQNASCCGFSWHQACIDLFSSVCGVNCPACVGRDHCVTGPPMDVTCDKCVVFVCEEDPFCCNVAWDFICVTEAVEICNACGCDHHRCETGGPLAPICGDCAAAVCQVDPFCCNVAWDSICVLGGEWACGQCP